MLFTNYFHKITGCIARKNPTCFSELNDMDTSSLPNNAETAKEPMPGITINRRGFFGTIGSAAAVLLLGKKSTAAEPGPAGSIPLCRCFIAGFQFHQGLNMLEALAPGQQLVLRREPENKYDQRAIAVHTVCGSKIGYLPRRLNEIPSGIMDNSHSVKAVITEVRLNAPTWEMVEMEICLG